MPRHSVPALLKRLQSENAGARAKAAKLLGLHREPRAVAPLLELLRDRDCNVQAAAAEALGRIGDEQTVEALLQCFQGKTYALIEQEGSPGRYFKIIGNAAEALGRIGTPPAVEVLLTTLQTARDEDRQAAAAFGLRHVHAARVTAALQRALRSPHHFVRYHATEALNYQGEGRALAPLLKALRDKSWPVQVAAAQALGNLRDPHAAQPLRAALEKPETFINARAVEAFMLDRVRAQLQAQAARGLARLGDAASLEVLERGLSAPHLGTQLAAAVGLAHRQDPRAFKVLSAAWQAKAYDFGELIVAGLAAVANAQAVALLKVIAATRSDVPIDTTEAATEALRQIATQPPPKNAGESRPHQPFMRILCFGAGAIGTYIGGSLALTGHEVAFIERPTTLPILQAQGLRLQLPTGEQHVTTAQFFESPAAALQAGPYDFAVFALKSFDTAAALDELQAVTQTPPPILCLQNGVDNEPAIAQRFGAERVVYGTVTSAVGKPGVGHIVVEKLRGLGIAQGHPLSAPIVTAFKAAGLQAQLYPNAAAMKWSKLFTNLVGNATAAILDLPVSAIFADPALFQVEMGLLRECLAVMRGLKLQPIDLPQTPVRLLAFGVERVPGFIARPLMLRAIGGGRGAKMPSFHIDLHSGRGQTEAPWLHGAVAQHGKSGGIPTPICATLTTILADLSAGRRARADFRHQPAALLRLLP